MILVNMDNKGDSQVQTHSDNQELIRQILSGDIRKNDASVFPPAMSPVKKLMVCLGSVLFPPMGLIWGVKYLKHPHQSDKVVGLAAIILTIISIAMTAKLTLSLLSRFTSELNQEFLMLESF